MLILCIIVFSSCAAKITFDIGDATLVSGETEQIYNEEVPLIPPVVEKEGYVFDGWDPDPSAVTGKTTIIPKWKKANTITFDPNGGIAADTSLLEQTVPEGTPAKEPSLTREGYHFAGWNNDFSSPTSDMTVTAVWKKIHKVTFDTDGGEADGNVELVQYVIDGENAALPTVTKRNYNFVSWDSDATNIKGDTVIKAKWERKTFTGSELYKLISPATVEIETFRLEGGDSVSIGSGFFIDDHGTLLTNYHVITEARVIKATTADEKEYNVPTVIAYDKEKDIAILKADIGSDKVDYIDMAPSVPETGEVVYALGSSLGLTGTFSSGIVSYANRDIDGVKFIQTSAPISEGNSGGPLVTEQGYVVGINSASYTEGQNLNLAIEISQYKTLQNRNMTVQQFFDSEATIRWWIGEKKVMETAASSGNGQIIYNGDTVTAVLNGRYDKDIFMTEISPSTDYVVLIILTRFDIPIEDITGFQFTPFASKDDTINSAVSIKKEFCMDNIIKYEDGTELYMFAIAIPAADIGNYKNIGVIAQSTDNLNYEVFFWMTTQEQLLELASKQ